MKTTKKSTESVAEFRKRAKAMGLKRLDIYAHPEDFPAIKAYAKKLQKKRATPPAEPT